MGGNSALSNSIGNRATGFIECGASTDCYGRNIGAILISIRSTKVVVLMAKNYAAWWVLIKSVLEFLCHVGIPGAFITKNRLVF